MKVEDERCCGTGTCIIDAEGRCWCGQQWNGTTMCYPERKDKTSGGEARQPADEGNGDGDGD
ncbi:MAG: hypothetical protein MUF76_15465 [Hydrogenophaga sp.]|jgi:hypothetical protein|nr:hypothetical protein [Hydrogenophaga sp.]